MTKKKSIYFLGLLLVFFGIVNSCRQELNSIENENAKKSTLSMTHKKAFEFNNNTPLLNQLSKAKNDLKKQSKLAKNADSTIYSVNSNEALYIEDNSNNRHSYIFNIPNNDATSFDLQNLVLAYNGNNAYDAYLVTYNLTETERNLILSGENVDITQKTSVQSLNYNNVNFLGKTGSCFELTLVDIVPCSHPEHQDDHQNQPCMHPDHIYEWTDPCANNGGSSGGTTGSGSTSGTSGGGSTGTGIPTGNTSNNPNVLLTPTGEVIQDECIIVNIRNNLAKNYLERPKTSNRLTEIKNGINTATQEKSFSFGDDASSEQVTNIKMGTNGMSVEWYANTGAFTIKGAAHTHMPDSYFAPSAGDLYSFIEANTANPYFQYLYTISPNNNEYVYTITNNYDFKNFTTQFPKATNMNSDGEWIDGTIIGNEFKLVKNNLLNNGKSEDEAFELATAFILNKYKTGVAISKKNSNGDFKPIFVEEVTQSYPNPVDPVLFSPIEVKAYLPTSNCNLSNN